MGELNSVLTDTTGVLVSFFGPLNPKSNEALITLSENSIVQCEYPRIELLRAKSVVNECLQNVKKHGLIDENGETLFYLIVECTEQGLQVKCANFVCDEMAGKIKMKLNQVNEYSPSELRKRSVELLCNSEVRSDESAGLGLINIGINSNRPINFTLDKCGSNEQLFTLSIFIDESKA
jgi:hypothetical protein